MGKMPRLGEKKTFVPQAFESGLPLDVSREVTGTVIWVHPAGRYYVVRVEAGREAWHETFYID